MFDNFRWSCVDHIKNLIIIFHWTHLWKTQLLFVGPRSGPTLKFCCVDYRSINRKIAMEIIIKRLVIVCGKPVFSLVLEGVFFSGVDDVVFMFLDKKFLTFSIFDSACLLKPYLLATWDIVSPPHNRTSYF